MTGAGSCFNSSSGIHGENVEHLSFGASSRRAATGAFC